MKRLIMLILLLAVQVFAQDQTANVQSSKNSSTTLLDSAAVFTGTTELLRGYNSLSVTVRADQNGTYKILFGHTTSITVANADKTYLFSYTANDTITNTKYVPVDAPYYKIVYTNDTVAQTKFYLTTMLNKGHVLPITSAGKVDVNVASSALPSGAATSANQVTHNTKLDSLIADLAVSKARLDSLKARWDTWLTSDWATKSLQDSLKTHLATLIAKHYATYERQDSIIQHLSDLIAKDFATAAKQDSQRVDLALLIAKHFATYERQDSIIQHLSDLLLKDFSTSALQDSVRADLAVIIAKHFATYERQDSVIQHLSDLLLKDFATETTLSAFEDTTKVKFDLLIAKDFATQTTVALIPPLLDSVRVDMATIHSDLLALGIDNDTTNVRLSRIEDNQTNGDQVTQLKSSSSLYTKIGTSVAALDSATFGFTSRHIGINNDESGGIVDSTTMYVSTTSAFSAGTTFKLYAGENLPLDYTCTKLYFKFGSTAKASKSYRFIVN